MPFDPSNPLERCAEEARLGNPEALRHLHEIGIEAHRNLWRGFFIRRGIPYGEVDDAVQELVLELSAKIPSLREPAAIMPFIRFCAFSVARRKMDELIRTRKGESLTPYADEASSDGVNRAAAQNCSATPEQVVLLTDVRKRIFSLLSPQQASILLLKEQGYTEARIGGLLGVSVGTIKKQRDIIRKKVELLLKA